MNLDDFLGPDPVVVDLHAETRWEVIDELIGHLVADRKIKIEDRDAVVASVRKREISMTTGIGFGIGIPHASTELVADVVVAYGRSRNGIQFEALDGRLVHKVFLLLVPQGQFQKHQHTLAKVAKLLHRDDFRDGL